MFPSESTSVSPTGTATATPTSTVPASPPVTVSPPVSASPIGPPAPTTPAASTSAPAPTSPDAPGRPATVAGDEALAATWESPVTHGAAVTGYTATATPGGNSCTTTATTCVIGNLSNGTAYRVTVVARSAAGDSEPSAASPTTTPAGTVGAAAGLTCDIDDPDPGETVTLTAYGFRPGTAVTFVLHSRPYPLGSVTADATGRAALRATLPPHVDGSHVITADGLAPDGTPLSRGFALTIGPGLPQTGADLTRITALGVLLLCLGIALQARRRPARH